MTELLTIETDQAFLEILPELGGGVAAFDFKAGCARAADFPPLVGRRGKPADVRFEPDRPLVQPHRGRRLSRSAAGSTRSARPTRPTRFRLHGDGWFSHGR